MTAKMRATYKAAKKDKEFIAAIASADNDKMPSFFADDLEKSIVVSTYYGYLVAKHGDNWKQHIY